MCHESLTPHISINAKSRVYFGDHSLICPPCNFIKARKFGTIKRKLQPMSTIELSFLSCATRKIRVLTKKGLKRPVVKGLRDSKGPRIAEIRVLPM